MEPNANQLGDMGLLPMDGQDEQVRLEDWPRRNALKTAILATKQSDMPTGTKFWLVGEKDDVNGIRCKLGIHLVTCTAVVTAGNTDGSDKALTGQTYMCKKESAAWSKKYLTNSNADGTNLQHLKMASNPDTYSVSNYTKYVPAKVKDSEAYKTLYFNKHIRANSKLTMEMITVQYHSFKCSLDLYQNEQIQCHMDNIHGISGGPVVLKPI